VGYVRSSQFLLESMSVRAVLRKNLTASIQFWPDMLEFGWVACFCRSGCSSWDHMCMKEVCREWVGISGLKSVSSCSGILPLIQLAGRCILMLSGQNVLMAQIKPGVHHAAPA